MHNQITKIENRKDKANGSSKEGLSTITTYKDTVEIIRTYCLFKKIQIKDYVADLAKKDLKNFEDWLDDAKRF